MMDKNESKLIHEMFQTNMKTHILLDFVIIVLVIIATVLCGNTLLESYIDGIWGLVIFESILVVANVANAVFTIKRVIKVYRGMREEQVLYDELVAEWSRVEELLKESEESEDAVL